MKQSTLATVAFILAARVTTVSADVHVPPGYYLVEITEPGTFNVWTSINNVGQIVWHRGYNPFDAETYEICLYEDGIVRNVTNDTVFDRFPSINDRGDIVWSRASGPGGVTEIARMRDGELSLLTNEAGADDPQDNTAPRLNPTGDVVWTRRAPSSCSISDGEIWTFTENVRTQRTNIGGTNGLPDIDANGDLVWSRVDFCASPVDSQVLMLDQSGIIPLSPDSQFRPQRVRASHTGRFVWSFEVDTEFETAVAISDEPGSWQLLTEWGFGPSISDNGEYVAYSRWIQSNETWQISLWHAGVSIAITDDDAWNFDPDVNDYGELAWGTGANPYYQVRAILRRSQADINCDGTVSVADIPAFVLAVARPSEYAISFPECDLSLADLNGDLFVTVADIGPFVARLLSN